MKIVALILLTLYSSSYYEVEATPEVKSLDKFEDLTAEPYAAVTVGTVISTIVAVGNVLEKLLTEENIQKIMKFGKSIFQWGQGIIEQARHMRNVTSIIKSKRDLETVKQEMKNLNAKMDIVDRHFDTIKTAIDWTVLKVKMTQYEGAIRSLNLKLQHYLDAPADVSETFKNIFIDAYEQHFADAPLKIYYTMTVKNSIFNKNLFEIARKTFHNDIRQVSKLAGYLVRLIQKGLEVQFTYYDLVNLESRAATVKKEWEERFTVLEKLGKEIDEEIQGSWRSQSLLDLDAAMKSSQGTTNDKLAAQLYKQVSEKYKWRKWFVLVYTYTSDEKDHLTDRCDGFEWDGVNGKTVVVNSFPTNKTSPRINLETFFNAIPATVGSWNPFANSAKKLFDMVPSSCDEYSFKAVIHSDAEVQMRFADERATIRSVEVKRLLRSSKRFTLVVFD